MPNFLWGVATSCYQIEGAVAEDGRGPSIWDAFSHTAGKTLNGETGDVACDHYHRYREDVALMGKLGVQAYRFSTAWPRILPQGRGKPNQKGLDFYSRLVDALLGEGIRPIITLYHWDLPLALGELGWTQRDTAYAFADYAQIIGRHLGDRVQSWITLNEPWCASFLSHQLGIHAPGVRDWPTAIQVAHHLLLAHGLGVQALRDVVPRAEVGIALNFEPAYPATNRSADYHAARLWEGYYHRWFLDPIVGRNYPADIVRHYTEQGYLPQGAMPFIQDGDLDTIATPIDFLGINYYTRHYAREGESLDHFPFPDHVPADQLTAMNWEIFPHGLSDLLCRLHFEYKLPKLYITENGCSYPTGPDQQGDVADQQRIAYLEKHLAAVLHARDLGVPVQGYFQWSFLDNYEWALGYSQRFGLVYVDYATQQRIPKASAYWYQAFIQKNNL